LTPPLSTLQKNRFSEAWNPKKNDFLLVVEADKLWDGKLLNWVGPLFNCRDPRVSSCLLNQEKQSTFLWVKMLCLDCLNWGPIIALLVAMGVREAKPSIRVLFRGRDLNRNFRLPFGGVVGLDCSNGNNIALWVVVVSLFGWWHVQKKNSNYAGDSASAAGGIEISLRFR